MSHHIERLLIAQWWFTR